MEKKYLVVAILSVSAIISFPIFLWPASIGGNTHYLIVLSGSMEPTIPVGGIIIARNVNASNLEVGDVIVFQPPQRVTEKGGRVLITHRIVEVTEQGFVTKGDACEENDKGIVTPDRIVAKQWLTMPYVGYGIEHMRTVARSKMGFLVLIVLPASIIMFGEIRRIILIEDVRKITEEAEIIECGRPSIFSEEVI